MIERTVERFALEPDYLAADVAYGTGEMLGWLVERGIDPHIPVWDQSEVSGNGKFCRADFAYDKLRDCRQRSAKPERSAIALPVHPSLVLLAECRSRARSPSAGSNAGCSPQ
jgi:hypothetical protein